MIIFTPNTVIKSTEVNANFAENSLSQNLTNNYKFSAYKSGGNQNVTNATATVTFQTELFDTNNNFASSTYTVPATGYYFIGSTVRFDRPAATGYNVPWILVNSVEVCRGVESIFPASAVVVLNVHKLLFLNTGDAVTIGCYCDGGTSSIYGSASSEAMTNFYGFFVSK
jgi:hypothetical protein